MILAVSPGSSEPIANILENLKTVDGPDSGLDADTLDGNHASAFLMDSGHLFDTSGYQKLSNGLIFQWLYISDVNSDAAVTHIYPVAFSSLVMFVDVARFGTESKYAISPYSTTLTQVTVDRSDDLTGAISYRIFAIGY